MSKFGARQAALIASIAPTWQHSFLGGTLPAGATFARGSAGWYFDSAGTLVSASSNVARLDYDPVTLQPLGYLAEMQSTNGLTNSSNFGSWSAERVTVTANAATAPDGTTTASQLIPTAVSGPHGVFRTIAATSGDSNGFSVFAKAGTSGTQALLLGTGEQTAGVHAVAVFDLINGVVGQTSTGTTSGSVSASIRPVGNGWYRCSVVVATTDAAVRTYMIDTVPQASGNTISTAGQVTYTPNGTDFIYIWGAQKDTTDVGVTSYIPTAGSTVTRAQDILSLPVTSLPGWRPTQGGVLVATYRLHTVPSGTDAFVAVIGDGTNSNEIYIDGGFFGGDSRWRTAMTSGGSAQFSISGGVQPASFDRRVAAVGWGPTRGQAVADGTVMGTASGSYTLPTLTTLQIGYRSSVSVNGIIESIAYYARDRADAFVQRVSL